MTVNKARLRKFEAWAERHGVDVHHDVETADWHENVRIHTFRVEFDTGYVEVNGHLDDWEAVAGEDLDIVEEEWTGGPPSNHSEHELSQTGSLGFEDMQVQVKGDALEFIEVGPDHRRHVTIQPCDTK